MCGNTKAVKFKKKLTAINFPSHLASLTCNLSLLILEKVGSTLLLANHKKGTFLLKSEFLGESQRQIRRLSNQISSFSFETILFF